MRKGGFLSRWMVVGDQHTPLPETINRAAPQPKALTAIPIYGPSLMPMDPLRPLSSSISEVAVIRRIVIDTTQMKKSHLLRDNEALAQEARKTDCFSQCRSLWRYRLGKFPLSSECDSTLSKCMLFWVHGKRRNRTTVYFLDSTTYRYAQNGGYWRCNFLLRRSTI